MNLSVILLTYKGKVLLMNKDYVLSPLDNPWHFITGVHEKHESAEQTITREVKKETSVQLKVIEFLGSLVEDNAKKCFYHTHLTDDNVNHIIQQDGKNFGFFSVSELDNLLLSISTKLFIARNKDFLRLVDGA